MYAVLQTLWTLDSYAHRGRFERDSHPLIKHRPGLFVADSSTAAEVDAAKLAWSDSKPMPAEKPRRPSPYKGWRRQPELVRDDDAAA